MPKWIAAISVLFLILNLPRAYAEKSYHNYYTKSELAGDAARYAKRSNELFFALKSLMTEEEVSALRNVQLQFPMPRKNDYLLNFYATVDIQSPKIYLPFMSLKALEDLTTAYAWLQVHQYSHSTIDLYYMMLRYRPIGRFTDKKLPTILEALGIPKDAYKEPGVDKLSLKLRNQAWAFVIAHEAGHILYRHKGYNEITKEQARQDEIQSDRFAMDLLFRDNNMISIGGFLFFKALAYNFTHRSEFKTEEQWENYMHNLATHPLNTDRIRHLSIYAEKAATQKGAAHRLRWMFMYNGFKTIEQTIRDKQLFRCLKEIAIHAPMKILKPSKTHIPDLATTKKYCRDVVK